MAFEEKILLLDKTYKEIFVCPTNRFGFVGLIFISMEPVTRTLGLKLYTKLTDTFTEIFTEQPITKFNEVVWRKPFSVSEGDKLLASCSESNSVNAIVSISLNVAGEVSNKGDRGEVGSPGPKGDKGDKGDIGAIGSIGLTGAQGIQGLQGLTGQIGIQGIQGDTGLPGNKGDIGIGVQGIQGNAGQQGEQGIPGPQGIQGDAGPQGIQGNAGAGYSVPPPTIALYSNLLNIVTTDKQCIDILLTGNSEISLSGGIDGTKTLLRIRQDGIGSRLVTFGAMIRFSGDIKTFTATTTPNKMDYVVFIFNAPDAKYDLVSYNRGF